VTPAARARWIAALGALIIVSGALPWALALAGAQHPDLWLLFRGLCHQRPERTLAVLGAPMLVCSRCAGLYAGVALGALLPLPAPWLARGRALVLAALGLTILDVITQDLGLHPPWHPTRLATGLLLGWTASAFMFATLRAEARARQRAGCGAARRGSASPTHVDGGPTVDDARRDGAPGPSARSNESVSSPGGAG
jgi:uncharacterized membrane protein